MKSLVDQIPTARLIATASRLRAFGTPREVQAVEAELDRRRTLRWSAKERKS
jgi:hypothetical protein